jgi:hypothetical protein
MAGGQRDHRRTGMNGDDPNLAAPQPQTRQIEERLKLLWQDAETIY